MEVTVTVTYLNGTIAAYRQVSDIGQANPDVLTLKSMGAWYSVPLDNVSDWKTVIL